jgi:hypothetical protein
MNSEWARLYRKAGYETNPLFDFECDEKCIKRARRQWQAYNHPDKGGNLQDSAEMNMFYDCLLLMRYPHFEVEGNIERYAQCSMLMQPDDPDSMATLNFGSDLFDDLLKKWTEYTSEQYSSSFFASAEEFGDAVEIEEVFTAEDYRRAPKREFMKVVETDCIFRPLKLPEVADEWGFAAKDMPQPCLGDRRAQVCGPIVEPGAIVLPHSCIDSSMRALVCRQALKHPDPDLDYAAMRARQFEDVYFCLLARDKDVELMTDEDWLTKNTWNKSKKLANRNAMDEYVGTLEKRHLLKKSFIKEEVNISNPYKSKPFRERFIQGNQDPYNVAIAPAIKSCASYLKKVWNGYDSVIHYACRSNEDFGTITTFWHDSGLVYYAMSDFVHYDSHEHTALLQMEARVYKRLLNMPDDLLNKVIRYIKCQEKTHGYISCHESKTVIEYWGEGRRASGMPNTSIGNTILNAFAQLAVLTEGSSEEQVIEWIKQRKFILHLLGDDMLLQATKDVYEAYRRGCHAYELVGLPATGELLGLEWQNSEFLRKRAFSGEEGMTWLPMPGRILQRAFVRYAGEIYGDAEERFYAHTVAEGLLRAFVNTPVITRLLERVMFLTDGAEADLSPKRRHLLKTLLEQRMKHWPTGNRLSKEGIFQFRKHYGITLLVEAEADREIDSLDDFRVTLQAKAFHYFHEIDNLSDTPKQDQYEPAKFTGKPPINETRQEIAAQRNDVSLIQFALK